MEQVKQKRVKNAVKMEELNQPLLPHPKTSGKKDDCADGRRKNTKPHILGNGVLEAELAAYQVVGKVSKVREKRPESRPNYRETKDEHVQKEGTRPFRGCRKKLRKNGA